MKHAGWAAIVALLASLASSAWGADKPVGLVHYLYHRTCFVLRIEISVMPPLLFCKLA